MYGLELTLLLPLHAPAASWCGPAFYPSDVHAGLAAVPCPRILVTTPLEIFGATEVGSIASRRTLDGEACATYPGVVVQQAAELTMVSAPWAAPVELADRIEALDPRHFRLLGRRTDLVKLGGRRASLSGLNRILTELEGVADGAFLVPDDLEQRVNARLMAVVVAPGRSPCSILAELRGLVDPLFLPRRVICVDALPRNELGKLPR